MSALDWKPDGLVARHAGFEIRVRDNRRDGVEPENAWAWTVLARDNAVLQRRIHSSLNAHGYADSQPMAEARAMQAADALAELVRAGAYDFRWGWPAQHEMDMAGGHVTGGACCICGATPDDGRCLHTAEEIRNAVWLLRGSR